MKIIGRKCRNEIYRKKVSIFIFFYQKFVNLKMLLCQQIKRDNLSVTATTKFWGFVTATSESSWQLFFYDLMVLLSHDLRKKLFNNM